LSDLAVALAMAAIIPGKRLTLKLLAGQNLFGLGVGVADLLEQAGRCCSETAEGQAALVRIGNILALLFLQRKFTVRAAGAAQADTLAMAEQAEILLMRALLAREAAAEAEAEELSLLLQPAEGPSKMSMGMRAVLVAAQVCSV
jgi:hypothetical protein